MAGAQAKKPKPKPNPVGYGKILDYEKAPDVRRLDCRSYDRCLDVAIENNWDGFTCNSCNAHEQINFFDARKDMEGMAALIEATPDVDLVQEYTDLFKRHRGALGRAKDEIERELESLWLRMTPEERDEVGHFRDAVDL